MNRAVHKQNAQNFVKGLLIFVVAFVLGVAVTLGGIVGGIYAALAYVSIDTLEGLGIDFADSFLEEDSELRHLSVLGMVGEVMAISGTLSTTTFNSLMKQYGVIVSDDVRKYLPDGLVDLPFSSFAGEDAAHVLLSHITFGDIFDISGEILPEALAVKLTPRTLDLAVEQKFDKLLEGVYLGDAINVPLVVREDGLVDPDIPEGERARLVDHLATLNLGEFFAAEDTEAKDAVLNKTLGRVPLSDIMAEEDGVFGEAISDKFLGDLLIIKDLSFLFSMDPLLEDMYLGHVLGYHQEYAEDGETFLYWADENDKKATGIYRELVGIGINELNDINIMEKLDNVYVAELMGYDLLLDDDGNFVDNDGNPSSTPVFRQGTQEDPIYPSGMTKDLAVLKVGELRTESRLNEEIRSMKIGVVMGYEYDEATDKWYRLVGAEKQYATGVMRPLLNSTVGSIDEDMETLYLGQVMGFDVVRNEDGKAVDKDGIVIEDADGKITGTPVFKKDGNHDGDWNDTVDTAPGALMAAFVDMRLSDIDKEDAFTTRINNVRVGDAMGYTEQADGWYQEDSEGNLVRVTGMFQSLASYKVNGLEGAVQDLTLADALGYTYDVADKRWEKNGIPAAGILSVLMDSTLNSLSEDSKGVYVGQIMGYTIRRNEDGKAIDKDGNVHEDVDGMITDPSVFYKMVGENEVAPSGVTAEFVDMTVEQLESEGAIKAKLDGMSVGTAMGYTQSGDMWVDANGDEATGFMELIGPETTIVGLDKKIKDLSTSDGGSIQAFMDAEILTIDLEVQTKLDNNPLFSDWRNDSIGGFVDRLLSFVP